MWRFPNLAGVDRFMIAYNPKDWSSHLFDIRGSIQEVETYAVNQTQGVYLTEIDAICCLIPGSNITLNIAA